ncbi:cold-shock protein [Pseudomonas fluorescens ABAC62]|nr:cold-shock protein [Pseudomonas fluorescens ABAC62]
MSRGIVKWFDIAKGCGCIRRYSGGDVSVHYSAIEGEGYKTLVKGQKVEFGVERCQHGVQATRVHPLVERA